MEVLGFMCFGFYSLLVRETLSLGLFYNSSFGISVFVFSVVRSYSHGGECLLW